MISQQYPIGTYVNADLIEAQLAATGFVNLLDFGLETSLSEFETFAAQSTILDKVPEQSFHLSYQGNIIIMQKGSSFAYEAAFLADFIRHSLLTRQLSFSFETVMSHPSKVGYFSLARSYLKNKFA